MDIIYAALLARQSRRSTPLPANNGETPLAHPSATAGR